MCALEENRGSGCIIKTFTLDRKHEVYLSLGGLNGKLARIQRNETSRDFHLSGVWVFRSFHIAVLRVGKKWQQQKHQESIFHKYKNSSYKIHSKELIVKISSKVPLPHIPVKCIL